MERTELATKTVRTCACLIDKDTGLPLQGYHDNGCPAGGVFPAPEAQTCVLGDPLMHGPQPYRWCATHNRFMWVCERELGVPAPEAQTEREEIVSVSAGGEAEIDLDKLTPVSIEEIAKGPNRQFAPQGKVPELFEHWWSKRGDNNWSVKHAAREGWC